LRSTAERRLPERRAYLNFGESAVTVVFAEGDEILFLKYIPGGGHQLDQAVARHLNLGLADAAQMRTSVTTAPELDATNELHRSVIDAVRGPLEATTAEIELCLRYYKVTFRGRPLERITLTGSEAGMWLAEFLTERLALHCDLGNAFERLSRWPTSASALERPWRWTTAVGLALKR
jgi:type IV pilus assembly protein PilM